MACGRARRRRQHVRGERRGGRLDRGRAHVDGNPVAIAQRRRRCVWPPRARTSDLRPTPGLQTIEQHPQGRRRPG
eukprot:13222774-Alexandrium_andersonii.AAC.1